jgi:hypothetical protein
LEAGLFCLICSGFPPYALLMPALLLLLACFLVLMGPGPAAAQPPRVSRVGLKLGGSLAQYRGKNAFVGNGNLGGYCGGGILHLPVSAAFSVQPELLYSQKGARGQTFIFPNNTAVSGTQRLVYAEVPILAKLRSKAGLYVELGPSLSYLLSASADFNSSASGQGNLDNRSSFKPFEWGYAAGAGFQTDKGFMLGARYTRGLTSVFKAGAYRGVSGEADIYNQAFQLYAGLIFFGRPQAEFSQ